MKVQTNLSIDEEIKKKAQAFGLDLSAVAEKAFKDRMNIVEVEVKDKCEFCGKDEVKACKETNYIGLTWLCPDERWICDSCLKRLMSHVHVST